MTRAEQSYENHARRVPLFHYVLGPLLLVVLVWFLYRTVTDFSVDHLMMVVLVVAVSVAGFWARAFPLGVQDRVIRLEERLRLERLLPAELHPRIAELTTRQLVALRFAPDDELEALTRRVLDGDLAEQDEIKRAVWVRLSASVRPDDALACASVSAGYVGPGPPSRPTDPCPEVIR